MYDQLTTIIEQYVTPRLDTLIATSEAEKNELILPIIRQKQRVKKSRKLACQLLLESINSTMQRLQTCIQEASTELWYPLLRRIPRTILFHSSWHAHATLAVMKWAQRDVPSAVGPVEIEQEGAPNSFGMILAITPEMLDTAFRIASLTSFASTLLALRRSCSKGATLNVDDSNQLILTGPAEYFESITSYEARSPRMLFTNQGVPTDLTINNEKHWILHLFTPPHSLPIAVPDRNITLFVSWLPYFLSALSIRRALESYAEAILDDTGIDINVMLSFFIAFTHRCFQTLPSLKDENSGWVVNTSTTTPDGDHRLGFLFGLLHRGYLYYSPAALLDRIMEAFDNAEINQYRVSREALESFLDAAAVEANQAETIDPIALRPCPCLVRAATGTIYIDLTLIVDFFETLIERGKRWLSSQHGDRFTLWLKRYIERRCSDVQVIGSKVEVKAKGRRAEIDLLLQKESTLYAIECKAFSKSRDFLMGEPKAVSQRRGELDAASQQARRAVDVLAKSDLIKKGRTQSAEWMVCTPSQEFIYPMDRFGFLNATPRVCTPEELASLLNA